MNEIIQLARRPGSQTLSEAAGCGMKRFAVVTPVLDDWHSFATLVREIACHMPAYAEWLEIVAIDDGSSESLDPTILSLPDDTYVDTIRVVRLALNLGSQRAIAVGLVMLAAREDLDGIIVMDSDGEDRPEEIPSLIDASNISAGQVILAHRGKRSESTMFKVGYGIYKFFFRVLTGHGISFGNFSVLPIAAVRRLVHMPELWNNLPAAIIRSRLQFTKVHTIRGTRHADRSKMSFPGLVIHGLSAMSVYTDFIFVRVLLAATAISALSLAGICAVLTVRLGTTLAIPGWATTIFGDLLIILFQAIVMIVATSLMVLGGRSARPIVPIVDALVYVQSVSDLALDRHVSSYGVKPE